MIKEAGLTAVVLRPWYVLGPGRRWPLALLPLYKIAEWWPSSRETARRLGLVTIEQMVQGLVAAVETPPPAGQIRVVDVVAIRCAGQPSLRNPAAAGRLPGTRSLNDNQP
jgi:hypothetical protein